MQLLRTRSTPLFIWALAAGLVSAAGCRSETSGEKPQPAVLSANDTTKPPPEGEVIKRGESLSATNALPVDECIARADTLNGKPVKVTGTIEKVCQNKGCWFTLKGQGGEHIRITSKGYKFFVPSNVSG